MKKLIFITNSFPFGMAEASFIRPEIEELKKFFDITVVSRNTKDEMTTDISGYAEVIRYDSKKDYGVIKLLVKTLLSSAVYRELKQLAGAGKLNFRNIKKAVKYFMRALHFAEFLEKVRASFDEPVLLYTYWNDYSVMSLSMIKREGDRLVSRAHRGDLYERVDNGYYLPMKVLSNKKTDLIAFISDEGKEYFESYFPVQCKKEVFRLGVGAHGFKELKNSETLNVLSLSYILPVKRVELIARALGEIDDIKINWTHIGAGKNESQILNEAEVALGGKENILYNFTGEMENREAMKYIAENDIDLLINASASEGVPVTMMEAMSFGIPVIGTDVGAVSEIIKNGCNGFLIENNENVISGIGQAVRKYAALNGEKKLQMKKSAYETWEKNYNSEKNAVAFAEELIFL